MWIVHVLMCYIVFDYEFMSLAFPPIVFLPQWKDTVQSTTVNYNAVLG